jgi:hypothetical protein
MRFGTVSLVAILAATLLAMSLTVEAQPAMPVIGYLSQRSPTDSASIVAAFRQGLKEMGFRASGMASRIWGRS